MGDFARRYKRLKELSEVYQNEEGRIFVPTGFCFDFDTKKECVIFHENEEGLEEKDFVLPIEEFLKEHGHSARFSILF